MKKSSECECASGPGQDNIADVSIVLASFEADGQVGDKGVPERVEGLLAAEVSAMISTWWCQEDTCVTLEDY